MLDYSALAARIVADGGFTVDLDGNEPTSGYAVALKGYERIIRVPSDRRRLADHLYLFVIDRGRELRDPGAHLGAWLDHDTGRIYLDVTHIFEDRQAAITLAELNGQLAIFDLSTGAEIRITIERVQ